MSSNTLRVRWAGPAVAGALLLSALAPQRALAVPAVPLAAMSAARMEVLCAKEAAAYIVAINNWVNAWTNYQNSLPGGTANEIMDAAILLDQAATQVGSTGFKLVACLAGVKGPTGSPL